MNPSDLIRSYSGAYKVIVTNVSILAGSNTQVLSANPQRWAVIFGTIGAFAIDITPDNQSLPTFGLSTSIAGGLISFSNRDFPGLPQFPWFAGANGNTTMQIIEIVALQ